QVLRAADGWRCRQMWDLRAFWLQYRNRVAHQLRAVLFHLGQNSRFQFSPERKCTPDRLRLQCPAELSVLGASTDHGRGQSYLSEESYGCSGL
ncbi:MAG: hypothetical protein ABSB82_24185, partial [Terriglobia bacterium]